MMDTRQLDLFPRPYQDAPAVAVRPMAENDFQDDDPENSLRPVAKRGQWQHHVGGRVVVGAGEGR